LIDITLPVLWIDSQEKSGVIDRIDELPEFFPRFEIKDLVVYDDVEDEWIKCGDYSNEYQSFIVEHKIIWSQRKKEEGDFHSSLIQKRLQDQCAKMHLYCENNKTLMIEGYLVNYAVSHPTTRNLAYSYVGKLANMNIGFTECYDEDEFLEKLYWINKESGKEAMARTDVKNEGRFIISQLVSLSKVKNIGPIRAKSLFRELGNIEGIIIWMNNNFTPNIKGFGPMSQQALWDWRYDEVIINNEGDAILKSSQ